MSGQLAAVIQDLESAQTRLHTLYASLPCHVWGQRPGPDRWSPAECVAHLNLTSERLLPLLAAGLQQARSQRAPAAARYRRDPVGWLIWQLVSPSGRLKTATVPAFVPDVDQAVECLMTDFERLQADVISCAREAAGLPIDRVKLASPFDAR
ncbi:MAG TPA: DinB family protein, partial [Vicinamibacterales bacterium]